MILYIYIIYIYIYLQYVIIKPYTHNKGEMMLTVNRSSWTQRKSNYPLLLL